MLAERPERGLQSMRWKTVILLWAWSVLLGTAPVEFVHGRNRNRSRRDACWTTFVSNYLLQEGKLQFDTLSLAHRQQPLVPTTDAGPLVIHEAAKQKRTRKKTALSIFSSEYGQLQNTLRRGFNWVRNQDECKRAYDALPLERRALYEERAALSLSAAQARALLMVKPAAPLPLALAPAPRVGDIVLAPAQPIFDISLKPALCLAAFASETADDGRPAASVWDDSRELVPLAVAEVEKLWEAPEFRAKAASESFKQDHSHIVLAKEVWGRVRYPVFSRDSREPEDGGALGLKSTQDLHVTVSHIFGKKKTTKWSWS